MALVNFKSFSQSLEQFFLTVGTILETNFCFKKLILKLAAQLQGKQSNFMGNFWTKFWSLFNVTLDWNIFVLVDNNNQECIDKYWVLIYKMN